MSTEIHVGGLSSSIPGAIELTGGIRPCVAHGRRPAAHRHAAGAARSRGRSRRCRAETPPRRRRGKARADSRSFSMPPATTPSCSGWPTRWPGSRRAVIWGRAWAPSKARSCCSSIARRGPSSPTMSRAAASSRKSWRDWVFSSRSGPGTTTRTRWSRSSVTTSGSPPIWDGTATHTLRRESDALRALRRRLTGLERQRLRELGRTLSLAVEATCRNFDPGEREADVAGHLAHRLIREGVVPVDLRVASDDRLARFRQPTFKASPIRKRATIAVTGRRHGLCASVTRTVAFGAIDAEFREHQALATMVDATCIFFSRPGEVISEVFRRAKRIYEKFDHPHEWTLDYQGSLIGYSPREVLLRPDSNLVLESNMALSWSPSVGAARTEDTVVVDSRGYEVVTEMQNWPAIEVAVKGYVIPRPAILER